MNAFNHIGLATVGAFLVSSLAGIRPLAPGFERILLQPLVSRETGGVRAVYQSVRGSIETAWTIEGGLAPLPLQPARARAAPPAGP